MFHWVRVSAYQIVPANSEAPVLLKLQQPPHFAKSSNGMGLQYYWRQNQGGPEFSLEVTNALVAMVSNSSGMEDGEGLEFWMNFVLVW
jgi:hypothetical protein